MSRLQTALALAVLISGCDTDPNDTQDTEDTLIIGVDTGDSGADTVDLYGHPRFVHLAADLTLPCDHDFDPQTDDAHACTDLYASGSPLALNPTPFPFGGSTSYPVPVPPLPYVFDVYTAGSDIGATNPLISLETAFDPGEYKTMVVYGSAQVAGHGYTVIDDDPTPPASGKAKVRVFHAHNVQLILGGLPVDVTLGTTPIATDLQFSQVSDFVEVDPGTDLMITIDTNNDGAPDNAGLITLADGEIAELFMVDTGYFPEAGQPWYIFLKHSPETQEPEIVGTQAIADVYGHPRLVHLASEIAPSCDHDGDPLTDDGKACVDIYIPGMPDPVNGDLAFPFGASTAYPLPFQPGTIGFDLYEFGADTSTESPVMSPQATFGPGEYKTIITHGSSLVAGITTTVIDDDITPPSAGNAKVRVIHTHNVQLMLGDLPIGVNVGATPIASGLQYSTAGSYVEVAPGTDVSLTMDTNGDSVPDNVGVITLADGEIADLFLIDTGYFPDPNYPWYAFLKHSPTTQEPEIVPTMALADIYGHPRFVHLASDMAPPCDHDADPLTDDGLSCVDLYVSGSPVALNGDVPFPFGGSTSYPLPFQPTTFTFDMYTYGADIGTATPVLSPQATFTPGEYNTIVTYGSSAVAGITSTVLDDDLTPPSTGNAKVRVFHGNNAQLALGGASLQVLIGTTSLVDGLQFGLVSDYVEIAAGTDLSLSVDTNDDSAPDNFGVITLADGEIADLFLIDTGYFPDPLYPWYLFLKHSPTTQEPELVGVIVP